jgi:hypothetical protein
MLGGGGARTHSTQKYRRHGRWHGSWLAEFIVLVGLFCSGFKEINVGLLYRLQFSIGLQRTPGVPRWGIWAPASCMHTHGRAVQPRSHVSTQGSDRQYAYKKLIEHE